MKKIVGIIAAAALAASAFAEVNIGSWSRGTFVPFAYDGDDVRVLEGDNWEGANYAGTGVRTGLGFSASSENAGVVFDVFGNNTTDTDNWYPTIGDNAYVWAKPVEVLRLAFGKVDNNLGRANVCFGNYDHAWRYARLPNGEGIGGSWRGHGTGANITLTPVEGLVIDYQTGNTKNDYAYNSLFRNADLMIGYTIPDTAFIRAIINPQKLAANKDGDDVENIRFTLAADVWAVENLTLTAAVTVPTVLDGYTSDWEDADGDTWVYANSVDFGVGAHYNLDPITIHGFFDGKLQPKEFDDDGSVKLGEFGFAIAAGVDFKINDVFTLITDFRFMNDKYEFKGLDATNAITTGDKSATFGDSAFGAYVGICQQLTNASFDFGVMLANNYAGVNYTDDSITFAVPLTMTVSF